jgi:hypothetical protein
LFSWLLLLLLRSGFFRGLGLVFLVVLVLTTALRGLLLRRSGSLLVLFLAGLSSGFRLAACVLPRLGLGLCGRLRLGIRIALGRLGGVRFRTTGLLVSRRLRGGLRVLQVLARGCLRLALLRLGR